jgi:hypothetical protein
MKRIFTLLIVFTSGLFYAQTTGITYQAVIYNPAGEILPGNNNLNAVLANQDICLRFSIKDAATNLEYQETQKIKTDEFGMVNLVIGQGNQVSGYASNFDAIHWNSATKKLQVEMDITGNCSVFIEVSNQNFSAVPFAYASKTAENVSGIVAIANGGTGASTVSGAKTNLGLNNVDNTSDANKPISTATQAALDTKAPLASPALTGTPTVPTAAIGTNSTQIANTAFVNSAIAAAVTQDATNTVKGKLKLTGDLGGTADAPTVPGLVLKAPLDSPQFTGTPTLPTGTIAVTQSAGNNTTAVATTAFVNSAVAANTVVDATTTTKGKIKLAGDLAGTADAPTVPGLANKENTVLAGTTAQYYRGDKTWQTLNKTAVGLGNVDNTSDASKPVSTATQTALNAKEDSVNKSTNTSLGTSDVLFPTQNAVKTYVDNQIATTTIPDATTSTKGKIKLAGDLGGTADLPTVPGLTTKENAANKSTNTSLGTSDVLFPTQNAVKTYVDNQVSSGVVDATTTTKGKIKLAGDLAGTADAPTVPGLANKENTIAAGTTAQYYRGDKTWQTLDKIAVGLGNVDNTSDASKPTSTATQTALNAKENTIAAGTTAQYYRGDKTWQTLDKTAVGLGNVENTSDASKPISTDTQAALDLKANLASPTFTGDAKAATAATGDNDTSIATTAFVSTAITNAATPDATTSNLGKIQLGGDLAGPNSSATVPVITTGAITALKLADASVTNAKIGETIAVANGGTGATSLTGYLKGNGTSAFTTESTIPVANVAGAVRSVNGALPATDGNVSVLIGNVYTGNGITPTTGTTPVRSDIYIVAGQTGTPNDNGRTFIYDGTTWHEISTNIAALDNTFVKLSGSTMSGNLVFPTGNKITIVDAPTGSTDVANRGYVDTKIGGSGTTNYVPKFLGTSPSNTLTNSSIFDDGTKVGIGTASPTTILSVQGSANVDNANVNTGTIANSLLFGNGTGEGIGSTRVGTTNLHGINFFTFSILRMALTNSGYLGIGTSSPFTPLSNTSSNIFGSDGQGVNGFSWSTGVSGYTAAIYNSGNLAKYNGLAVKVANNDATTYALDISRGTAQANAGTPLFDVLGNGNVGVGTASPASKLDVSAGITSVNSAINATGSINDFLQYNIQNTSTGLQAQSGYSATADNGNATSGFAWLGINNSGFNYPTAYNIGGANDVSFVGSGQDMYLANANNTKSIIFSTGKSTTPFFNEQMRILNNGNVGIGTNAPANKLEIKQGTAGNSGLRFTNLNSSSTATTSASKVLGLNSTGDVILTNIPGTQNIVSFSTASPNTGSPVFTPNTPADQSIIYQSATDNSLWTYNGTTYVTYTAPTTTAWNLSGTTNDAGGTKISSISRTGNVGVGISSPSAKFHANTLSGTNNVARFTTEGTGTNWATIGLGNSSGAWSSIAAGDSKFQIRNFSTDATVLHADLTSGNVGIGTTTPSKILDVVNQTSGHIGVIEAEGPVTSSYSRAMAIRMRRGTLTSPSALQLNDVSAFAFAGYDGSAYSTSAAGIAGLATENWNSTNKGMALTLSTTQNATSALLERMRIDHNGNIGIGTTAPTAQLEVATTNTAAIFRRGNLSGGASNIYLQRTQNTDPNVITAGSYTTDVIGKVIFSMANNTNYPTNGNTSIESYYMGAQTAANSGGGLTFKTTSSGSNTSTERMRIEHNGNVGIGTASPTTNLDVVGGFSLRNTTGSAGSNYGIEFNTNSSSPRIDWVYNGGYTGSFAGDSDFFFRLQNSKLGSGGFRFMTNPSGAAVERMTILNNGNIGIGMTNPTALLEISSTAANGVAPKLRLTNGFSGGKKWELQSGISGVSDASFGIYNVTDNLQVLTAKATGEVGIGTSTPDASAKLDLTATNKGFLPPRVTLTGTADVSTIATPATGLLVYNTATAGTVPAAVQPGYYYYNGTRWVPLAIPGGASVNVQGGAYTLTANDSKGVVIISSTTDVTVTVPATLPVGFFCQIIQKGTGQVIVAGDTGVSVNSANGTKTRAQYSSIGLLMESSTTGYVSGDSGL